MAKGPEVRNRVVEILEKVGIPSEKLRAFPHEFSGGRRQRMGIAPALILRPKLIVCHDPVSALDVSIQAQVINLLAELKKTFGLSYILIAHHLSVVNHISKRIAVMYLGKIIVFGTNHDLLINSLHPYTKSLISDIPVLDPDKKKRIILTGELLSPLKLPPGCRFHPRCCQVKDICKQQEPTWTEVKPGHFTACQLYQSCSMSPEQQSSSTR